MSFSSNELTFGHCQTGISNARLFANFLFLQAPEAAHTHEVAGKGNSETCNFLALLLKMKAVIKRRAKWQPDWYLGVAWERAGMPSTGSPGVVRTE